MFFFGTGTPFIIPVSGNLAANPTPMKCGTLQDISVDISGDTKELFGQNQFADDVARGKVKISGKVKLAKFNTKQINDAFFGQTLGTAGTVATIIDEADSVPATPFQVTVAQSAHFVENLGVRYAATGKSLVQVTSGPVQGQYSVNTGTGVYTFAAADTLANVLISYSYTISATGAQLNIVNQPMGFAPKVELFLSQPYNNEYGNLRLYSSVFNKLALAPKQDDYTMLEMDFTSHANPAGKVFDWYFSELTE